MRAVSSEIETGFAGEDLAGADTNNSAIGARIRELRTRRGLSVRRLAEMSGVSPSLISHLELGKGAPSVKTLYGLVAALGVGISEMFEAPQGEPAEARAPSDETAASPAPPIAGVEPRGPVQRKNRRASIELEHGFRWERLTTGSEPGVEFIETIIGVGEGRPDSQMKTHSGREYGVVLDGVLGIKLAFDTYLLEPGDSIAFDSTTPHCMWNAGDKPTRTIWFVRGPAY